MKEIELKILGIDKEKVIKKLKKMNAKELLKPTLLSEVYFAAPK